MCYNLSKYIVYPSIASQLFGCIDMNRDVIIASRNPEMEDNGLISHLVTVYTQMVHLGEQISKNCKEYMYTLVFF